MHEERERIVRVEVEKGKGRRTEGKKKEKGYNMISPPLLSASRASSDQRPHVQQDKRRQMPATSRTTCAHPAEEPKWERDGGGR